MFRQPGPDVTGHICGPCQPGAGGFKGRLRDLARAPRRTRSHWLVGSLGHTFLGRVTGPAGASLSQKGSRTGNSGSLGHRLGHRAGPECPGRQRSTASCRCGLSRCGVRTQGPWACAQPVSVARPSTRGRPTPGPAAAAPAAALAHRPPPACLYNIFPIHSCIRGYLGEATTILTCATMN